NAATFSNGAWTPANQGASISNSQGAATQPKVAAADGSVYLLWADDRIQNLSGNTIALYVKKWNGSAFVEELPGDASGQGISDTGGDPQTLAFTVDNAGHPLVAGGEDAGNGPQIFVRADNYRVGAVYYVNDGSTQGDEVCTAPGANDNSGLSPSQPLPSVKAVLNAYTLHAGDVIVVDAGTYTDGITVPAASSGFLVLGVPGHVADIQGLTDLSQANGVILDGLNLAGGFTAMGAASVSLTDDIIAAATLSGGSGNQITHDTITAGLTLTGGTAADSVEHNAIQGVQGVSLTGTGATGLMLRDNQIAASSVGIELGVAAAGQIVANDVSASSTGLDLRVAFNGPISNNRIHNNVVGVATSVADTNTGLGFIAGLPNQIYANTTGVQLNTAVLQDQHIYDNSTGVSGSGSLISADLDHANLIELNNVGVNITGSIEFNRIASNVVGIQAQSSQLVAHNLVYRNTQTGLSVRGQTDVRVFQNTFYSPAGDLLRIEAGSSDVEVRNNIFWAQAGYDLYVANDSHPGFFSDYNDLHASGTGKIVFWEQDFSDVLDWQQDVGLFDLHSIGTTVVHPTWSQPRFYGAAFDDYRVLDQSALLRLSSPTIDAGDPLSDQGVPAFEQNLLVNPGFDSGLTGWVANPSGTTQTANPAPWEGSQYFTGGTNADTTLSQTIDLVAAGFTASNLDSQNFSVVFGGRVRSAAKTPPDTGAITLTFLDSTGTAISHLTVPAHNLSDRWELVGGTLTIPVGTRRLTYTFEAVRKSGTTSESYLDGAFLYALPTSYAPDQGAYGNTTAQNLESTATHIALRFPDLYTDWEKNVPHGILWNTYNNSTHALVRIDLYQDGPNGPQFLTNITPGAPDTGSFTWIPGSSGIDFGTHGLRIQVTLVGNPNVFDRSTETFAVPENTNTFFVNDGVVNPGDLTTAPGSVRNTGKLASSPKPFPNNILNIYSVGSNQTLTIDAGNYALLAPLVISNTSGIGNSAGFALLGPSNPNTPATLSLANPLTHAPVVELTGADFMTLENLTMTGGQNGLLVDNSSHFTGSNLTVNGNRQDGLLLSPSVTAATLDHITAFSNGGNGITADAGLVALTNSTVDGNVANGVSVTNAGSASIEANTIYGNGGYGLLVTNAVPATTTVVGNADLTKGRGNKVYGNFGSGIAAGGSVLVAGNTVNGQVNANDAGIVLAGGALAADNDVYGNYDGIVGTAAAVTGNRVYHNTSVGILADGADSVQQNVVYSNAAGIQSFNRGNSITNDLVYTNATLGIGVHGGPATLVVNNTVYQPLSDALDIDGGSTSVSVRNNILWSQAGFDISVATDSQTGFASDFNDFYVSGTGKVGLSQSGTRATLTAWQGATLNDLDSLSHDPLFVNPTGAEGVVGYVDATHDGSDDDFHEQSQVGSFHGGALAPVVGSTTGLPVFPAGTLTADAAQSPTIDRGAASDSFADEPTPNGGYINQGAYGNTPQASESPTSYVLVMSPSGGESWPKGNTFNIRWRSQDMQGTVRIDLLEGSSTSPVLTIGTGIANTGSYAWTVPTSLTPAGDYMMRVTRQDAGAASGTSTSAFSIAPPATVFYVNDGTVNPGDWTTAPGNDANDGLTPATPKATIQAILLAYHPGYGDTLRVDAGTYNLTSDIQLSTTDSGVTIVGYNSPANPSAHAVLDRGNQNNGSDVFDLTGANDVTLDHLSLTDAALGVQANDSGSQRLTVSNCQIYGNAAGGINLFGYSVTGAVITGNRIHDNNPSFGGGFGITAIAGGGQTITNNVIFNQTGNAISASPGGNVAGYTITGNTIYANGNGISAAGTGTYIASNTAYDNLGYGISVGSGAVAANNSAYGQTAGGVAVGIQVAGGEARDNTVYDNYNGITGSGLYDGNRVFDNSHAGIMATGGSTVSGNIVYSNDHGIEADSSFGGPYLSNNLVYANATYGIGVHGARSTVTSNTVYQPTGDALVVDSSSANVQVENNILWAVTGHDMTVSPDSEIGFQSDYNDLVTANGNLLGNWEGRDYSNRIDWFYELGFDQHSITADPQFVNPAGPDGILGFSSGPDTTSPAQIVDDSSAGGFGTMGKWTAVMGGYDGEALESSDAPTDTATYTFNVTPGWYQVAATWPATSGNDLTNYTVFDGVAIGTVTVDQSKTPSDFNASGAPWKNLGDFYIGGNTITVQLSSPYYQAVADAVLVQKLQGDHGADDDFHVSSTSPTIDAGDPKSAYSSEPTPNGGRINLGYDGNTAAATASSLQFVQEISPAGLEKLQLGQTVPIRWRAVGISADTVNIDLLRDGDPTLSQSIASHVADTGEFDWTIPAGQLLAGDYRIRISINGGIQPQAVTPEPFLIANNAHNYYVNDGSTTGDVFTTAVGNDANSGKSPAQPVASLAALLTAYHFQPGDVIHVDTGTYNLTQNIRLTAQDSGVTIVGPSTATALLNRGNTNSGTDVFELDGATNVTLQYLSVTGGNNGIYVPDTGSTGLSVSNCNVYGNAYDGIWLYGYSVTNGHIVNNLVHDNGGASGIAVGFGAGMVVTGNTVYHNHGDGITASPGTNIPGYTVSGNTVYGNGNGINAGGSGTLVQNNTVYSNQASGVVVSNLAVAASNTIYGQVAEGAVSQGISLFSGEARNNTVFDNYNGIVGAGLSDGNRVFHNLNAGIVANGSAVVTGNQVYSNSQGIQGYNASNDAARGPYLTNNLVYAN
ncbi:MAG TPA: right-handed parallel beta-helix repeat-containing protein, partial [Pirellulales bacterium]|nr:right-handed parallel beta-helix repeat-containing protein [Pirellulales bacterium]